MEFWHGFLLITSVHLLAAASPGPDFVLVSRETLTKGRRTGLICSLGITLGLAVHIIYSVLGLAAVIAHSQPLLTAIKWLGGAYLIYLGCQGIGAKPKQPVDLVDQSANQTIDKQSLTTSQSESTFTILRRGFFCNVFNPKAPVYFVAIFT
ncbi:LysE family translocator, partial [Psychrobacter celer]